MDGARLEQLVSPFYLKMMRLNAIEYGDELAAAMSKASRSVGAAEVIDLLGQFWRERVMGAWFSLLCTDDDTVLPAVLRALTTSNGSLDAPPLTVAAVVLGGAESLPAIELYVERDVEADWGASGFGVAAIERLGGSTTTAIASDEDRAALAALLELARRLRPG